jgi:signal transduction histidine kinase
MQGEALTQVIIAGTCFMLLLAGFVLYFVLVFRQKQVRKLKEEETEREKLMLNSRIEISEITMQNISQELHDNIGQSLTLAKMSLQSDTNVGEPQIDIARQLITRALQDLRDLSKSLNGNYILDLGLEKAVQHELGMVESSSPIRCEFESRGEFPGMSEQSEVILFRCIQESLNNVMKHSEATHLWVQFITGSPELQVIVKDNGKGFISAENEKGVGLSSIRQRVELLGGKCHITSLPGKGTTVILNVPFSEKKTRDNQ